jgi:GH24 family phage-related lysozyme (muramidase)
MNDYSVCRLTAYQDSDGVWCNGRGHRGPAVHPGMTITQD